MLSDEEKKAIEIIKNEITRPDTTPLEVYVTDIKILLILIKKQQKENEELKREKETNQQMIQLAETQILGYGQGYKDGLNKETTATAIVARERENQIIYEGMKHKINMEWVLKIKAKIEEIENTGIDVAWEQVNYTIREQDRAKIEVLQSLLEKE